MHNTGIPTEDRLCVRCGRSLQLGTEARGRPHAMAESVKYPTAAGKIVTSRPPLSRQQTRPDGPGQAWGRPPWLQSSAIAAQRAPNGRKIDRRSGAAPRKRSATAPLLSGGMGEVGRGAAGRPSEFLSAAPSMALGNCGSVLHGLGLPGTRGGGGFLRRPHS